MRRETGTWLHLLETPGKLLEVSEPHQQNQQQRLGDAAEDRGTDTIFLGQQPQIARVSTVKSPKGHFHPKPSLGIIHEVEDSVEDRACQ